jgi:hypothetical protein
VFLGEEPVDVQGQQSVNRVLKELKEAFAIDTQMLTPMKRRPILCLKAAFSQCNG